jgi:hypothetical protein
MQKTLITAIFAWSLSATGFLQARQESRSTMPKIQSIYFNKREYQYRWSESGKYEFTPSGQENLDTWTDMVIINVYPKINDGDGLAELANRMLWTYEHFHATGKILRTNSIPRTKDKPAEHFIAAILGAEGQPFLECATARIVLLNGVGLGIIASHRSYGKQAAPLLNKWIIENGASTEKALMAFVPIIPGTTPSKR